VWFMVMPQAGYEEQRDTTEAHKISPAPTATAQRQKKTCKPLHFKRSVSGRYLWERSVTIPWRSITHGSTDREKVLQNTTLQMMRAMQAVHCDAY
jgi:hypothetical protein